MNDSLEQTVQNAIEALPLRSVFVMGTEEFGLQTLYPVHLWALHHEPCREPGSRILGEDSCGNVFLVAPDGSVSFWDHETDEETVLAASVEAFLAALVEPAPVTLLPHQIKRVWINPAFLEELKRSGDA